MPRTKQEMKLIVNLKKRKATYKNRRDGLVQKVSQLATLCDIKAFLICFGPAAVGGEVTTWPADGRAVEELVARFRALPPEKIKQLLDTPALLREELGKQQRKLLKVRHDGADDVLKPWDCSLDDLSVAGLNDLHEALAETLQRAQLRIAALGGHVHDGVVPSAVAVTAPAQHAPAFPDNAFDFPFNSSGSGFVGSQYHYPPHGFLPQLVPVQPPCLTFQMPPPCLAFQMTPRPALAAPSDFGMTGTGAGFMDCLPYATNVVNVGAAAAAGFFDDHGQGFAAPAGYDDDFLGHGFASVAGCDLEPQMNAGVWPISTLNNPMDAVTFQMQHNLTGLPGSSSSSFQGGFQNY